MHRAIYFVLFGCLGIFAIQGHVQAQYRYSGHASLSQATQLAYMQQVAAYQRQANQIVFMQQLAYYQQCQANQFAYMQQVAFFQGQSNQAAYVQQWAFYQSQVSPAHAKQPASGQAKGPQRPHLQGSVQESIDSSRKEKQAEQKVLAEENQRLKNEMQATKEKTLFAENDRLTKELQAAKEKTLVDEIERLKKEMQATKEKILVDENERLKKKILANKAKVLLNENERLKKEMQEQAKSTSASVDSHDALVIPAQNGMRLLLVFAAYMGLTVVSAAILVFACLRWKEISRFVHDWL